jgi:DNA-binding GntR family transcriptional regulator
VAEQLRARILRGELEPGDALSEVTLAESFGVSRTPVREALRKLQAKHLVVLVPNKGATVRVPSREELIDVYNLRSELEGYACELASAHVSKELLNDLDAATVLVTEAVMLHERDGLPGEGPVSLDIQLGRGNSDFHGAIARVSGNARLGSLIAELQDFFPKDYVWRAMTSSDEVRALNVDEHARIREALATGTAARARKEMRNHILHASQILLDYLDRLQFWQ